MSASLSSDPIVGHFLCQKSRCCVRPTDALICDSISNSSWLCFLARIQQTISWMTFITNSKTWLKAVTNLVYRHPKRWSHRPRHWALSRRPRLPLSTRRTSTGENGPKKKTRSSRHLSTRMVSISGRQLLSTSKTGQTSSASSDGTKWWIRGWSKDHGPNRSVLRFLSITLMEFWSNSVRLWDSMIATSRSYHFLFERKYKLEFYKRT